MVGASKGMLPAKFLPQTQMMTENNKIAPSPQQPLNKQGVRRIFELNTPKHDKSEGGELKVSTMNVGSMVERSGEVVSRDAGKEKDRHLLLTRSIIQRRRMQNVWL